MLPTRLLAGIKAETVGNCQTGKDCMEVLHSLSHTNQGIFLWLLEVMAEVAEHGETNRMSERAIAIVVAPNLYDMPDDADVADPMAALLYTQGMARFVSELLVYYVAVRRSVSFRRAKSAKRKEAAAAKDEAASSSNSSSDK